ncbi:nucleolar RNA helicase II [Trypanosoma cruzi]|nr:nucleolar RNA helicase II [Trypanosoma cruzi]
MHIYNGHIIVCVSWGEVRARVHARGHTHRERRTRVCAGGARLSHTHSHAATTAAVHATTRSKREEVVWETAVLPSLSPVVGVPPVVAFVASTLSFGLASLFSFCFSFRVPAPSAAGSLFGMPSSVLLSASLLAKIPFSVGDGGFVSAWPLDVSFCELAVKGANALSL